MNPASKEHSQRPLVAAAAATLLLGWIASSPMKAAEKPIDAAKASSGKSEPRPAPSAKPAQDLFDGRTLAGWKVSDFAGHGEVSVKEGRVILGNGVMTGITWTNDLPRIDYEISLDAMRVDG